MSSSRRPTLPQTRQEWRRQVTRNDDPEARHLATSLLRARTEGAYSEKTWKAVLFGLARDAIVHKKPAALRCLLVAGAPTMGIRKDQEGLLLLAAGYGEKDMVGLLLDAGADPTAVSPRTGRTLLHACAVHGDADWMAALVARGGVWRADDEGLSPLDVLKAEALKMAQPIPPASLRLLESLYLAHAVDEVASPRSPRRRRL